jgi:hypothetical protein
MTAITNPLSRVVFRQGEGVNREQRRVGSGTIFGPAAPPRRRGLRHGSAKSAAQRHRGVPYVRGVQSLSDIIAFAAGYEKVSGYQVAAEYLSRADLFVAVQQERVVGGFALNVEPPFRTAARLPEADRLRLAWAFPPAGTVELTCVWLDYEARGPIASAVLWASLVWQAARRRTHVVFGTEVNQLKSLYELTHPHLLYEGPVRVDGRDQHGWVYMKNITRVPIITILRVVTWRWVR